METTFKEAIEQLDRDLMQSNKEFARTSKEQWNMVGMKRAQIKEQAAAACEAICDERMIAFAEWVENSRWRYDDIKQRNHTTEQLLEIYKQNLLKLNK